MTYVLRVLNDRSILIEDFPIDPERMASLIELRLDKKLSSTAAQEVFEHMLGRPDGPADIAKNLNLIQVSDAGALLPIVEHVLDDYGDKVAAYLNGKEGLIGFFIGQVMRSFDGSPDPSLVRSLLVEHINKRAHEAD